MTPLSKRGQPWSSALPSSWCKARALECRHLAGELAVGGAGHPVAVNLMKALWDRSHKLEAIGMMLAKQYPPVDGSEKMVCRCKIYHGEVRLPPTAPGLDEPISMNAAPEVYVCAQCKLPKHGSGDGPAMVTQ